MNEAKRKAIAAKPQVAAPFHEVTADATHQGKTTIAHLIRDTLEEAGIPTTLVRIESQRVRASARPGDVFIASETFAQADSLPGGVAGVLRPLYALLEAPAERRGAIVVDWAGGLGEHRLEAWAATTLHLQLAKKNIVGTAHVVTTNIPARMAEAQHTLRRTAEVAPGFNRVLWLNEKNGGFAFPSGTEAGRLLASLRAEKVPVLALPKIAGESLAHLQPAGLDLKALLQQDPERLAVLLGSDEITVTACLSHIAAFHQRATRELSKVLPFPGTDWQA